MARVENGILFLMTRSGHARQQTRLDLSQIELDLLLIRLNPQQNELDLVQIEFILEQIEPDE